MCKMHRRSKNHMSASSSHLVTTTAAIVLRKRSIGDHAYLESLLEGSPELLRLVVGWVLDWEVSALDNNLLSSEWALGISPSGVGPPLLNSLDLSSELSILLVQVDLGRSHLVSRSHILGLMLYAEYII